MPGTVVPAGSPGPSRTVALELAATGELDILVIGGGITGAGVALDAATRGYRVALVERDDLGSGTSSRSSKLVHGGIRYLANGDVAMVAEGVRERDRLRRLAPHLVRPLGFVLPVDDRATQLQLKAGMAAYDSLALGRNVRRHERLSVADVVAAAPGLAGGFSLGGYRYYDCQTDDARLTLQVAQVARRFGVAVVNHAEVTALERAPSGRVVGAEVVDRLDGTRVSVTARWVVNAGGVWADDVRQLVPGTSTPSIVPAKGVHLVFPRRVLKVNQAVVVPSATEDGRMNFVVPWGQQVYVGTTDAAWEGDLSRPHLVEDEAHYLLGSVNAAFATDLRVEHAIAAWAGVRPLLSSVASASKDLSRKHAILEEPAGFVTVTGGKLTTYRRMAEDVVDVIAEADGGQVGRCVTARLPLGARGRAEAGLARTRAACDALGVEPSVAGSLYHRHGDAAPAVLAACVEAGETEPLVADLPYLRGEVRWAARHELVGSLDDVLQRRLRVSIRDAAAGGAAIRWVADVVAEELGWDAARRETEIDRYLERVRGERGPVPLDTAWRTAGG